MVEGVEGGGVETSVTNVIDVLQHAETDEGQKGVGGGGGGKEKRGRMGDGGHLDVSNNVRGVVQRTIKKQCQEIR